MVEEVFSWKWSPQICSLSLLIYQRSPRERSFQEFQESPNTFWLLLKTSLPKWRNLTCTHQIFFFFIVFFFLNNFRNVKFRKNVDWYYDQILQIHRNSYFSKIFYEQENIFFYAFPHFSKCVDRRSVWNSETINLWWIIQVYAIKKNSDALDKIFSSGFLLITFFFWDVFFFLNIEIVNWFSVEKIHFNLRIKQKYFTTHNLENSQFKFKVIFSFIPYYDLNIRIA